MTKSNSVPSGVKSALADSVSFDEAVDEAVDAFVSMAEGVVRESTGSSAVKKMDKECK